MLVRGLNALTATICTPDPAPVVAAARLRGGNAKHCPRRRVADHPGDRDRAGCRVYRDRDRADGLRLRQRRSVPRRGPGRGVLLGHLPALAPWSGRQSRRSAMMRGNRSVRCPRAVWDDQLRCWVSDAEVAETQYTAFASKNGQAITARLIVRRVCGGRFGASLLRPRGELERVHGVLGDQEAGLVCAAWQAVQDLYLRGGEGAAARCRAPGAVGVELQVGGRFESGAGGNDGCRAADVCGLDPVVAQQLGRGDVQLPGRLVAVATDLIDPAGARS